MAFSLPTFNLEVYIWRNSTWTGSYPPTVPSPDVVVMANLAFGRRTHGPIQGGMQLLLPAGTDIRDGEKERAGIDMGDIVEAPSGSGRYYYVVEVDDAGKGFANEHRIAYMMTPEDFNIDSPDWPTPYP